jgi:hypothetical protein
MKNIFFKIAAFLAFAAIAGCSPVQFYSDSSLSHRSGLKYYTVKPYLMVEREITGNNITKASVVYIPDLENPQYVVLKDGFGSRKLDLKLSDGTITSLGLTTEPLIAESVEALSALISKSASAIDDLSYIASGALGISFAFIEKVIPDLQNAVSSTSLIASWYCLAGVIFISLVAHFISIMANRWAISHDNQTKDYYRICNRWNITLRTINILMIIGLLIGIILLIHFVKLNL